MLATSASMRAARGVAFGTLVALLLGLAAGPAEAQSGARLFPETGKTVAGPFLDYWAAHGGLAQQGFPISEEFQEKSDLNGQTYTMQYFERAVFEKHPENAPPFDVLLSQLGTFRYKAKYPDGAPGQAASTANPRVFPETGKTLGGKFRTYWESHGGLAQQGFPISEEFQEKSDLDGKMYMVQYFERAVFEAHPENASPFDVLLSQLGTFQLREKYPAGAPTSAPAGPTNTPTPAPAVHDLLVKSDAAMNALTALKQRSVSQTTTNGTTITDNAEYYYEAPNKQYIKVVSPRPGVSPDPTIETIMIGTERYVRANQETQWTHVPPDPNTPYNFSWPGFNRGYSADHAIEAVLEAPTTIAGVPVQVVRILIPVDFNNASQGTQYIRYFISTVDYRVLREVTTVDPVPARPTSGLYTSDLYDFNVPTNIAAPTNIKP